MAMLSSRSSTSRKAGMKVLHSEAHGHGLRWRANRAPCCQPRAHSECVIGGGGRPEGALGAATSRELVPPLPPPFAPPCGRRPPAQLQQRRGELGKAGRVGRGRDDGGPGHRIGGVGAWVRPGAVTRLREMGSSAGRSLLAAPAPSPSAEARCDGAFAGPMSRAGRKQSCVARRDAGKVRA
jgi:hypothetical protein